MSADETVCNDSQKSSINSSRHTIVPQQTPIVQSTPPKLPEKTHLNALNGSAQKNALGMLKFHLFVCELRSNKQYI